MVFKTKPFDVPLLSLLFASLLVFLLPVAASAAYENPEALQACLDTRAEGKCAVAELIYRGRTSLALFKPMRIWQESTR